MPLRLFSVLPQDMRVKCGIDSLFENNSDNQNTVIVYCGLKSRFSPSQTMENIIGIRACLLIFCIVSTCLKAQSVTHVNTETSFVNNASVTELLMIYPYSFCIRGIHGVCFHVTSSP